MEYKYLGVMINARGKIKPQISELKNRLNKAATAIKRTRGKGIKMITNIDMFNNYVRP